MIVWRLLIENSVAILTWHGMHTSSILPCNNGTGIKIRGKWFDLEQDIKRTTAKCSYTREHWGCQDCHHHKSTTVSSASVNVSMAASVECASNNDAGTQVPSLQFSDSSAGKSQWSHATHRLLSGTVGQIGQWRRFYEQGLDVRKIDFHLNVFVNKHNFRYWADQNPRRVHEVLLHSIKVTVWCAVPSFGIMDPYYFF
jgi:hypothetical protein